MKTQLELRHLRRDIKTALELAIVALAPSELIDRLACAAGLLEAVSELPIDSPPALALVPRVVEEAARSLQDWQHWEKKHEPKASA
jgi:hypothetical protein